jgi:hypothetical protein
MEFIQPHSSPSAFAQIVDALKDKSEEELKMMCQHLFSADIKREWEAITSQAGFTGATEEDIIKAIQQNRYK